MKLSKNFAKPGEKLNIDCKTSENSSVYLLGAEQSSSLLQSGNDIDKSRITSEMNAFNANKNYPELKIKGNSENRYMDFGESNAFILTNLLGGEERCLFVERIGPEWRTYSEDDSDDSGLDYEEPTNFEFEQHPIETNFPETWIFQDFEAYNDGKIRFDTVVPDTMSSFIVTGFAVHPEHGLAVAAHQKVTVVQEFFLKLSAPYSVRFGEILKVYVTVFNYISRPKRNVNFELEMFNNDDEFEFVDATMVGSNYTRSSSSDSVRSINISVPYGIGTTTSFLIKPRVTGEIKLKIKATAPKGRVHQVERLMLVEYEGLKITDNVAKLFDLGTEDHDSFSFNLPINETKLISNSISIDASVIGDMMGPALENIHNLM